MNTNLLAEKLKELRKAYGYTQEYVASALEVVRQTYSNYETGKRSPSPEILYKIATLYRISVDDLMQLSVTFEDNIFYDIPSPSESSKELSDFIDFYNTPINKKKFQAFSDLEKQALYYFNKLSDIEKKDVIEFLKIRASHT